MKKDTLTAAVILAVAVSPIAYWSYWYLRESPPLTAEQAAVAKAEAQWDALTATLQAQTRAIEAAGTPEDRAKIHPLDKHIVIQLCDAGKAAAEANRAAGNEQRYRFYIHESEEICRGAAAMKAHEAEAKATEHSDAPTADAPRAAPKGIPMRDVPRTVDPNLNSVLERFKANQNKN